MRDLFEIVPAPPGRGARRPRSCRGGGTWLDATLPPDAVVLENFHYRALLPRPFVVGDRFVLVIGNRFVLTDVLPNWTQQLTAFVQEKQLTVLVTQYPMKSLSSSWLASRYGTPLAGPALFRNAARSPFNRGGWTGWMVTRLHVDVPASELNPR